MADVTLSYKGSDILELSDSGSATLKTGGTYCEDDIAVEYVKPSGGGNIVLLGSGTYTYSGSTVANLTIPVSYSGTALFAEVESDVVQGVNQTYMWVMGKYDDLIYGITQFGFCKSVQASGTYNPAPTGSGNSINESTLNIARYSSSYPIVASDYHWRIYGIN